MDKQLIFAGAAIVIFIACAFALYAALHRPVYKRKGQLLLLNEQRFLTALLQALPPNTIVSFKVRLLDIVSVRNQHGHEMNGQLADYCVDFVVLDRDTTDVKLCIEMDMESTSSSERMNKNTMISRALRRAGVPHVRLPLVRYYDPGRLRNIILDTMALHQSTYAPARKKETPAGNAIPAQV